MTTAPAAPVLKCLFSLQAGGRTAELGLPTLLLKGHLSFYLVIQRICFQRAKCLSKSKLCFKFSPSTLIICICGFNHLVLSFLLPITLLTDFTGEVVKKISVIPLGNKNNSKLFSIELESISELPCVWVTGCLWHFRNLYSFQSM